MNAHKSVRLCLMALFAAVFCYSAFRLISAWRLYSQNEAIYDDAADQFLIYNTGTQPRSDVSANPTERRLRRRVWKQHLLRQTERIRQQNRRPC